MPCRRKLAPDLFWNGNDWRRAWKTALTRINRAPAAARGHIAFRQAIDMLDGAFLKGDARQFQIGILLLDCVNEAIARGD